MAILISCRIDFKSNKVARSKGLYINKRFTTTRIYKLLTWIPNDRPSKSMKQKVTRGEVDGYIITAIDFNTPLSIMNRTTGQKIKMEMK